jgi:hypothetical protein
MLSRRRESRRSPRRPFRYSGWLRIGRNAPPIRCVICDVSDGGARLSAAAPHKELPDRFTLVLAASTVQRRCEVVWRDECFVGVRFVR